LIRFSLTPTPENGIAIAGPKSFQQSTTLAQATKLTKSFYDQGAIMKMMFSFQIDSEILWLGGLNFALIKQYAGY